MIKGLHPGEIFSRVFLYQAGFFGERNQALSVIITALDFDQNRVNLD